MKAARLTILAVIAAVGLALSPLTVVCGIAIVPVVMLGRRGLEEDERRWFTTILVIAIGLRIAAVAALFLDRKSVV